MITFPGSDVWPEVPIADETITVSTSVVQLSVPANAEGCVAEVITNPIRFTLTGRTPSPTVGYSIAAATRFVVVGRDSMHAFQAIREGAADATLYVTYFEARREQT